MNSKLKMGLKGVVIGAAIQVVAMPVMAEEIHGVWDEFSNLSLRSNYYQGFPLGGQVNTAIGQAALGKENGGGFNTAVGTEALRHNATGSMNVAIGGQALRSSVSGQENVAVGHLAATQNVSGTKNTVIGLNAMFAATSNHGSVAIGHGALHNRKESHATAIGTEALWAINFQPAICGTASSVAIGYRAGYLSQGCGNVFIGAGAGPATSSEDVYAAKNNQLAIANSPDPDSELITGDFAEKTIGLNGSVAVKNGLDVKGELRAFQSLRVNKSISTNDHLKVKKSATAQSFNTTSDARLKNDIQPIDDALSSVLQLQGKSYRWNEDEDKQDIGLIAQDVEQIFPQLVAEDANGFKAIAYSRLTAVLVEAIKEQQGQIASLQQENRELKSRIDSELSLLLSRVSVLEGVPLAQR